jgi:hypothetical protein
MEHLVNLFMAAGPVPAEQQFDRFLMQPGPVNGIS